MLTLGTGTGVLAATVVFAFAGVTGGCGSHPPVATSTPPAATTPPTSTVSSPPARVTAKVPVYYIGKDSRLYREYHTVPLAADTTAGRLTAGISQALGATARDVTRLDSTALDPDYHSGWPEGAAVNSVTVSGGVATVDLHGATTNGGTAAANRAAIQQLVWTATAYTGGTGVRLLFDGVGRTTLWATKQPVAGVLHRAPAVDTLAQMWVIDPQQGTTTGSPVTINVAGIVFEAQMGVAIQDASGATVFDRSVHLSAGAPAQGSASVTTTLAPGTYTVRAYFQGFKGVNTVYGDDHVFTVR